MFAHETAGAARTRLSLRPLVLIEGGNQHKARAHRAARMRTHILSLYDKLEIHTHVVPGKRLVQKPVVALPTQPSMPCTALARPGLGMRSLDEAKRNPGPTR